MRCTRRHIVVRYVIAPLSATVGARFESLPVYRPEVDATGSRIGRYWFTSQREIDTFEEDVTSVCRVWSTDKPLDNRPSNFLNEKNVSFFRKSEQISASSNAFTASSSYRLSSSQTCTQKTDRLLRRQPTAKRDAHVLGSR